MAADISPFRLWVFPVIMAQTQVLLTSMGFCPLTSRGARPGLALRNTAKARESLLLSHPRKNTLNLQDLKKYSVLFLLLLPAALGKL